MRLTDGVVTLRRHEADDVDELVVMGRDPQTARWTTVPQPFGPADARWWVDEHAPTAWRAGTAFCWAVEAPDADGRPRFAGNLDVRRGDVRRGDVPDVGYALAPWARGRGLMARALRLGARWAFDEHDLPVLHWSTHADNLASWRVAHACGFTFHGERPLSVPQRGELHDGWFASLRPADEPVARTTWWPCPELPGERVRLRPHTGADVPRMVEACTDPVTRHWLAELPDPYTDAAARAAVRRWRLAESLGQRVTWAVADRADDRLVGNIGVFDLDSPYNPTGGEIGYWAHPDARGRGLLSEALDLAVAHAFRPRDEGGLGRHRLQIGTAWSNTAGRRLAERAGFVLAARLRRDGVEGDGVLGDGAWYERLATDPGRVGPSARRA